MFQHRPQENKENKKEETRKGKQETRNLPYFPFLLRSPGDEVVHVSLLVFIVVFYF